MGDEWCWFMIVPSDWLGILFIESSGSATTLLALALLFR
jgi:hypothetical protein